ncbi:MAG: hypothetical protein M1832_000713 [Thelocarpon impressellum]|nr:MAG: hypothetical protein M1832_000713 [Thelocarpon impressellum]
MDRPANEQTAPASTRPTSRGTVEEAVVATAPAIGPTGNLDVLGPSFDFDWEASFDCLSAAVSAYEPQGELAGEVPFQQGSIREFTSIPTPTYAGDQGGSGDLVTLGAAADPARGGPGRPPPAPPQQQPLLRQGVKRKAESDLSAAGTGQNTPETDAQVHARPPLPRTTRSEPSLPTEPSTGRPTEVGSGEINQGKGLSSEPLTLDPGPAASMLRADSQRGPTPNGRAASDGGRSAKEPRTTKAVRWRNEFPEIPKILPHEKVFPVQIGSELFRLSGASISSDAPSYFTQFFERQLQENGNDVAAVRTLYIDRDPVTFRDISTHLQGYYVTPRDGGHFVRLFADAQFYSLPRLISQLFESEIFMRIGHRDFRIPRDIFMSPGDSPNFFSLGFAVFFASPGESFPGLNREGLLRPPSILPPSVPNHSADVFAELLHLLQGYPLHIRNEEHRAELLRDCKYYQFRGLEQRLIPHQISYNLKRVRSEIVIRLEDIRPSGVSFNNESDPSERSPAVGWVNYSRPFVDETSYELVLEIGGECTKVNFQSMRATFHGRPKARIASLFQVIANKMNLPTDQPLGLMMMTGGSLTKSVSPGNTPLSDDLVRISIDRDAHILLDGEDYWSTRPWSGPTDEDVPDDQLNDWRSMNSAIGHMTPGSGARDANSPPLGPHSLGTAGTPGRRVTAASPRRSQISIPAPSRTAGAQSPARTRKRRGSFDDFGEWVVGKGQWRLRVQHNPESSRPVEVVMMAVKLEAYSGERSRNAGRMFLSA